MANAIITIPIDPQTVRAYESAAPDEKQKIQVLLGIWLRELAARDYPSLQEILDEVGDKAKARGFTPEILGSLVEEPFTGVPSLAKPQEVAIRPLS
jgi:hypothetical protein